MILFRFFFLMSKIYQLWRAKLIDRTRRKVAWPIRKCPFNRFSIQNVYRPSVLLLKLVKKDQSRWYFLIAEQNWYLLYGDMVHKTYLLLAFLKNLFLFPLNNLQWKVNVADVTVLCMLSQPVCTHISPVISNVYIAIDERWIRLKCLRITWNTSIDYCWR